MIVEAAFKKIIVPTTGRRLISNETNKDLVDFFLRSSLFFDASSAVGHNVRIHRKRRLRKRKIRKEAAEFQRSMSARALFYRLAILSFLFIYISFHFFMFWIYFLLHFISAFFGRIGCVYLRFWPSKNVLAGYPLFEWFDRKIKEKS